MEKITAIYILIDPRTSEIRYVGKTINPDYRLARHIREAKIDGKKKYVYCWIRQLLDLNLEPEFKIIEWAYNWIEREKYWITYYINNGYSLTNLSEGGQGSSGYKHTIEWKSEASNRMKGNTIMVGKKHSEETKRKMRNNSAAKKNAPKVYQYDKDMNFIKEWGSVSEAAKTLGLARSAISNNLTNRSVKTKFGIWKYNKI